jgi:hypothetical protein
VKGKSEQSLKTWKELYGKDGCVEFPEKTMTLYIRTKENPDMVWKYENVVSISKNDDKNSTVDFTVLEDEQRVGYTIHNVISLESN